MFNSTGSQPFGAELYLGKPYLSLTYLHLMDPIWVPLSLGFGSTMCFTCNMIVLTTGDSLHRRITALLKGFFFLFKLTWSLLGTFSCGL